MRPFYRETFCYSGQSTLNPNGIRNSATGRGRYDFRLRRDARFRIFSEWGRFRFRGFVVKAASCADVDVMRTPNFYDEEPPILARPFDYDISWALFLIALWVEIMAQLSPLLR